MTAFDPTGEWVPEPAPVLRDEDKRSYRLAHPELFPDEPPAHDRPTPTTPPPPPAPVQTDETFAQMEARIKRMTEVARLEGLPNPFDHETMGAAEDGSDDKFVEGTPLPLDIMDKYGIVDPTDERQVLHLAAKNAPPAPPAAAADPPKPKAKRKRAVASISSPSVIDDTAVARRPAPPRHQMTLTISRTRADLLDALCARFDWTRSEAVSRLIDASHADPVIALIAPPTT